jgi:hypothetical protein
MFVWIRFYRRKYYDIHAYCVIDMERISNKKIMKKLKTIENDISNKEIIEKIDTTLDTVHSLQNTLADKETIKSLSDDNKKSVIVNYTGLSIAYLGIGLALLLSSLNLIAFQYSIIFGVFFGGCIVLAYLAYVRKKELKNNSDNR